MTIDEKDIIARTPNPNCPACQHKRIHNKEEWKIYHPHAGEGLDNRNKSLRKSIELAKSLKDVK